MLKLEKEWQKRFFMAVCVAVTLIVGLLLFYRHWQFALPLYPNVDEQLSLDCIFELLDQHLYAGDIYVLDFFRYPHLTFYYAAIGARLLGKFFAGTDTVVLLRYVICGTALLSNVFVYFSLKIMTGSRKWAYLGFLLSVFSLYGYSYLYYTGPDTLLYAVANVVFLLGCLIWREKDEERAVYLWYPLMAVCIGLAMAAKYHGIIFGIFWLALHIGKKYGKRYRNNYFFFLDCIVLALTFVVCNYSLFFHFKTFIGDNLYNLNHYAWGHPGIEHNFSLLGYLEAYALSSYGIIGGVFILLGVVCLIRNKKWGEMVVFSLTPLCVLIVLSKYSIVLGRNMSLALPFSYLFMIYGLMGGEAFLVKKITSKHVRTAGIMVAVIEVLVCFNITLVLGNNRYELSYNRTASYIDENIPAGAKLYCTSYRPVVDEQKYEIVEIGEDISLLPDRLGDNEYFIDVEYATGYYFQKKDYLFFKKGDMYPDQKAAYEQKTGNYQVMECFKGLSYGGEWKYRAGYFDLFLRAPSQYYTGPSIIIYQQNFS